MRFDESGAKPDSEYAGEFKAVGGLVGRLAINDITSFAESHLGNVIKKNTNYTTKCNLLYIK